MVGTRLWELANRSARDRLAAPPAPSSATSTRCCASTCSSAWSRAARCCFVDRLSRARAARILAGWRAAAAARLGHGPRAAGARPPGLPGGVPARGPSPHSPSSRRPSPRCWPRSPGADPRRGPRPADRLSRGRSRRHRACRAGARRQVVAGLGVITPAGDPAARAGRRGSRCCRPRRDGIRADPAGRAALRPVGRRLNGDPRRRRHIPFNGIDRGAAHRPLSTLDTIPVVSPGALMSAAHRSQHAGRHRRRRPGRADAGPPARRAGIDSIVVEKRDQGHHPATHRAGILERATVSMLTDAGVDGAGAHRGPRARGHVLRFDGESHRIDFRTLVGDSVWLYPQNEVFLDLADARERDGGDVRWAVTDTEVVDLTDRRAEHPLHRRRGRGREVRCETWSGADGSQSICRRAIPEQERTDNFIEYPFAWFGILAEAPPSAPELIYCELRARLRAHLPAQRDRPADVLPVRPRGGRRTSWSEDADLGRAPARGRRPGRGPAPGGPIFDKTVLTFRVLRLRAAAPRQGCSWSATPATPSPRPAPRA